MLKDPKSLKVSAISWMGKSLWGPEKWFVGHRDGIYSLRYFGEGFFNSHGRSQELFAQLLAIQAWSRRLPAIGGNHSRLAGLESILALTPLVGISSC
jgi:hypothetical protein